jgi:hypothetical protein
MPRHVLKVAPAAVGRLAREDEPRIVPEEESESLP